MSMTLNELESFIDRSDFQCFEENIFTRIKEKYTRNKYSITYDFVMCVDWNYDELLVFFTKNRDRLTDFCIHFYKKYLNISLETEQEYPQNEDSDERDTIAQRLPFWKGSTIRVLCYYYYLQSKDYKGLEALIKKCKIPRCKKFIKELIDIWSICFGNIGDQQIAIGK